MRRDDWRRYVGPAAFLLAVTIAVVLIRSGMNAGSSSAGRTDTVSPPVRTTHATTTTRGRPRKTPAGRRFWTVQAGDTFSVISRKTGVAAATIARLNPKATSTSLFIGEKIRIK